MHDARRMVTTRRRLVRHVCAACVLALTLAGAVRVNAGPWEIYCSTLEPYSELWYLFFCELAEKPPRSPSA